MVQWDWQHFCSAGTQVQSLAWHSGLRILHGPTCSVGLNCGWNMTPGLELHMPQGAKKEKKKILLWETVAHAAKFVKIG